MIDFFIDLISDIGIRLLYLLLIGLLTIILGFIFAEFIKPLIDPFMKWFQSKVLKQTDPIGVNLGNMPKSLTFYLIVGLGISLILSALIGILVFLFMIFFVLLTSLGFKL